MSEPFAVQRCAECGAEGAADSPCWLCQAPSGAQVATAAAATAAVHRARAEPARRGEFSFQLSSLMLVVTLAAVYCGVFVQWPGLGIVLTVATTPALIRVAWLARWRRRVGEPMSIGEKLLLFVGATGAFVATVVAAAIAFYLACWGGLFVACHVIARSRPEAEAMSLQIGMGVGLLVGLATAIAVAWLTRSWWRGRRGNKVESPGEKQP